MDDRPPACDAEKLQHVRDAINPDGKKIVMYTGTLEAYQGIPLLLDSHAIFWTTTFAWC